MEITIKDILKVCNGTLVFGDENIICKEFSKDTRTLKPNEIYVGIKGETFDGSTLYEQALEKGAKACIIQNIEIKEEVKEKYKDRAIIIVENTITAIQKLANYKRNLYNIPVIAITGSVGKTSTKDIIASVVSKRYKTLKTQGNLNNHIGLPLTILGLDDHEALVVEMGMNNLGEISVLTRIAQPNIAVITNVGTSHIGNLGSRENILKAKLEILEGLQPDGILIINNDNDMLNMWYNTQTKETKVITYGIENQSNYMAENIELKEDSSEFIAKYNNIEEKIIVPVGGKHFVYNALSAIAVGIALNIDIREIKKGIEEFELTKSRMELIKIKNNVTIINDCYNANYDSMKAGIEYLANTSAKRKIAVLGDMLELGEYSNDFHKKVGEEVVKNKIDILITIGEKAEIISNTAKASGVVTYHFENNEKAVELLKEIINSEDEILVKASNGMKFKEIVEKLVAL